MGQPIKNNIDYEQCFSLEMSKLLKYAKEEYINTYPVSEIPIEMFFAVSLIVENTFVIKVIEGYFNSVSITLLQDKLTSKLQEKALTAVKPGRKIEYSKELKNLFQNALNECNEMDCDYITSDHVLLALLNTTNGNESSSTKKLFNEFGLNYNIAYERSKKLHEITNAVQNDPTTMAVQQALNEARKQNKNLVIEIGNNINKPNKKKDSVPFCTNLNDAVKSGNIDDLIGRNSEIDKINKILNRRKCNNVLLVGESGCGKTAIVEGLAKRIVYGIAPVSLCNKVILKFNSNDLMSGTQLRGMLEDRVNNLFKELSKRNDTILFIDDFHKFMNEKKDDDNNLSGIFMPLLQSSSCRIIAATTYKGYKDAIEKNKDIETRFNRIDISSPNDEECFEIISKIKKDYEAYHNVTFNEDIIRLIIKLAKKYSNNKSILTFAIDVIDEIGSKKKQNILETEEIKRKRNEYIENFEDEKVRLELIKLVSGFNEQKIITDITEDDVYEEVAEYTNLPIQKITNDEKHSISLIDKKLKEYIIGQDEAIDNVSKAVKRNKVGLSPKDRPFATFMFIGKTGVGKTMLAKTLAKEIYGDEKLLVRFDMSEYSDKTSVNKLIGSSAGYIGYNDGGLLTEAIKSKKYCVLLFDEIEKADEQIYNLFLQIFDGGFLTDNSGQKVDFRNTIIILTSNVGTKKASNSRSLGFVDNNNENNKNIIEKELKKKFPPEFINRIDDVVYFNSLTDENLKQIIKLEINKLKDRLTFINYNLQNDINQNVIDFIFKKVEEHKEYGARPIIRVIQDEIENKITDLLLENEYNDGYEFSVTFDENANDLCVK